MKTIETKFTRNGWNHEQVVREGTKAIYKRWKETSPKPHYEVVRIQWGEERTIAGRLIPAGEFYPSNSSWGSHGWTFHTLEAAKAKFEQMVEAKTAS